MAPVALYDEKGNLQASGVTDANGIWQGSFVRKSAYAYNVYAVLGQPGDALFGVASENWDSEISPWNFKLNSGNSAPQPEIYFYTERPVYRPGDTVHYRGIIRSLFNGRYLRPFDRLRLVAGISNLVIALNSPNGKTTQMQPSPPTARLMASLHYLPTPSQVITPGGQKRDNRLHQRLKRFLPGGRLPQA